MYKMFYLIVYLMHVMFYLMLYLELSICFIDIDQIRSSLQCTFNVCWVQFILSKHWWDEWECQELHELRCESSAVISNSLQSGNFFNTHLLKINSLKIVNLLNLFIIHFIIRRHGRCLVIIILENALSNSWLPAEIWFKDQNIFGRAQ